MANSEDNGRPPTIGDLRQMGLLALQADCPCYGGCGRRERVLFDALRLPDDTVFLTIPRRRRLVCSRCGTRSVSIMPDWTDHVAPGNGRRVV